MTLQLLPMLKPFRQAVEFQLERVPMSRKKFDALSREAKLRAFTVAGLTRKSLLEEAHKHATAAIAEGLTKQELLDRLGDVLDAQGGVLLSPRRLDLIAQNNLATAYAAGRFAQMNDPEITSERPYRQYPLGPHDARTSQVCLRLEGLVARYDDSIWDHIFPPNHHGERHLQVATLTEEQAAESGKIYASPEGGQYPVVEGQTILPDPGFDYSPGLVSADDRALVEAASAVGEILPAKTASDYGLATLESIDGGELPAMPKLISRVVDVADTEQVESVWAEFQKVFSIEREAEGTTVLDVFGDGVRVNRAMFDKLATGGRGDRAAFAPVIRATLEDPFEVWMIARRRGEDIVLTKRYIGLFRRAKDEKAFFVAADEGPGGWLMKTAFPDKNLRHLEREREGRLMMTKARREK